MFKNRWFMSAKIINFVDYMQQRASKEFGNDSRKNFSNSNKAVGIIKKLLETTLPNKS